MAGEKEDANNIPGALLRAWASMMYLRILIKVGSSSAETHSKHHPLLHSIVVKVEYGLV
jgi:hypothetical protein